MTKLEINLKNAKHNYNFINNAFNKKVICVVKSNAYGHGAKILSKLYQNLGAYAFAVANIDEGVSLRKNGIVKDIIILGFTPLEKVGLAVKYNLTQSLISYEYAKSLNDTAKNHGVIVKAHIAVNTGMNRFGFQWQKEYFCKIIDTLNFKNLSITGLYTHFSSADDKNNSFNRLQTERYNRIVKGVKKYNDKLIFHASATSALFNKFPLLENACRIGIGLYGFGDKNLKPLLSLKTPLVHIAKVRKGDSIGYGGECKFEADGYVGIISVGYSNGFSVNNNYSVEINNFKYPVIGKICMNHTIIDLTPDKNSLYFPSVGDLVTVVSEYNFDDYLKSSAQTPYRALCNLGNLNKKVYR